MIPKLIHYCWLSGDPIPSNLQECMKSWKEKLPDYEFILWNFDKFDINSSLWVKQAFESKKYAFAADYIRLYAVYHYGGFYMDMDIEVLKSFNDLLDKDLALAFENDKGGIEAGCFGAKEYNPIIKKCLDYYIDRNFIKPDGSLDILPLPQIMAKYCNNFDLDIKDRFFFTCKSFETGIITTKPYSYTIHHFAGSWLSEKSKKEHRIRQKISATFGENIFSSLIMKLAHYYTLVKDNYREKGVIYVIKKSMQRIINRIKRSTKIM